MLEFKNRSDGMRPETADVYYENQIYKDWAFNQNKEFVKNFTDDVKANTVVDIKLQKETGAISDKAVGILESDIKKTNRIISVLSVISENGKQNILEAESDISTISSVAEFIKAYNQLIRNYVDPSINFSTRQSIKTEIYNLSKNIDIIVYNILDIIENIIKFQVYPDQPELFLEYDVDYHRFPLEGVAEADLPTYIAYNKLLKEKYIDRREICEKYLVLLIKAFCTYSLIQNDLYTGYFNIIKDIDIEAQLPNLLKELSDPVKLYIKSTLNDEKTKSISEKDRVLKNQLERLKREYMQENGHMPSENEIARLRMKLGRPSEPIDIPLITDSRITEILNEILPEMHRKMQELFDKYLYDSKGADVANDGSITKIVSRLNSLTVAQFRDAKTVKSITSIYNLCKLYLKKLYVIIGNTLFDNKYLLKQFLTFDGISVTDEIRDQTYLGHLYDVFKLNYNNYLTKLTDAQRTNIKLYLGTHSGEIKTEIEDVIEFLRKSQLNIYNFISVGNTELYDIVKEKYYDLRRK